MPLRSPRPLSVWLVSVNLGSLGLQGRRFPAPYRCSRSQRMIPRGALQSTDGMSGDINPEAKESEKSKKGLASCEDEGGGEGDCRAEETGEERERDIHGVKVN
ncbi:hypothetical protein NDU88_002244 [Pleurodeles waltl]|uniref:Uncharacterized protein n=1 Tax=Pleurodeles waltl TaxID=8319 RepID=A0AAV7KU72_PLEWA|nr:hypothetical protein NDU88_002244 [Pleurodeles waltl]